MARPRVAPRIRWWIVTPLLAVAVFLAPVPAWVVEEFYARDVYPWLQSGLTTLSNLAPFAVLDALIGVAAVVVLYRAARLGIVAARRSLFEALWEGFRRLIRAVAILALAFLSVWGCNYRRMPIDVSGDVTTEQTTAGLRAAVTSANQLGAQLRARPDLDLDISYDEAAGQLSGPMNEALAMLDRAPLRRPGRPKTSRLLDFYFRLAGVSGMLNPLALESIVQRDLVPVERAFVLAHEWAHLAGHADEAEASAVGWLACMKGGPALAYSASLYLIMQATSALPVADRQAVLAGLDEAVRADIDRIVERTFQQHPGVQRAASRVYDEYLRANRVADGTASYGRALTLILSPGFQQALDQYAVPPPRL